MMRDVWIFIGCAAAAIVLFFFFIMPGIQASQAEHSAACEAKGGVYLWQYKSKSLCLRRDVVIEP